MPALWGYARDLFQTPGFGDNIDFDQIKKHYYVVHDDINPTGIVPAGPDESGWSEPRVGAETPPDSQRTGRHRYIGGQTDVARLTASAPPPRSRGASLS